MNIGNFKTAFQGGTRSNRFLVTGAFGDSNGSPISHTFHVRSTFLPAVPQMVLEMNAYGRKLYIPGDREYGPWQITVYDDTAAASTKNKSSLTNTTPANPKTLWSLFSNWQNSINSHTGNITDVDYPHLDYKTNWTVEQLDLNGSSIKQFDLIGCWPRVVGDIDFNMTRRNFLNTFSVVLVYDEIRIGGVHDNGDDKR